MCVQLFRCVIVYVFFVVVVVVVCVIINKRSFESFMFSDLVLRCVQPTLVAHTLQHSLPT